MFDHKTGVYWAVDSFATPVPGGEGAEQLAGDVSELDDEFWTHGMTMFAYNALAPWLRLVDTERFSAEVGRLSELQISTIISAHSPAITGSNVQDALQKMRALPRPSVPLLQTSPSSTSSWRRRKGLSPEGHVVGIPSTRAVRVRSPGRCHDVEAIGQRIERSDGEL